VHMLDLAMWLSGHWTPTSVSAQTYAKFGPDMKNYKYIAMWAGPPKLNGAFDVDDYVAGIIRFGKDATLSFEVSWAANCQGADSIELLGDKGGVRVEGKQPLTIFTEDDDGMVDVTPQFDEKGNPFERQAATFLAAIRGEAPPAATGQQGLTIMRLLDAIYHSAERGAEAPVQI